jgi:hypothetical protein
VRVFEFRLRQERRVSGNVGNEKKSVQPGVSDDPRIGGDKIPRFQHLLKPTIAIAVGIPATAAARILRPRSNKWFMRMLCGA